MLQLRRLRQCAERRRQFLHRAYTGDAESQLKSATYNGTTTNYTYDGDGRRVSKSGSGAKLYWYGSGGDILAETDTSGNTTAEYIFFGGKRIAMLPAGGNPIFYVEDLLGTSRVITSNTGVVCRVSGFVLTNPELKYDADFYPFGGERAYTNTCPQNYKFEGRVSGFVLTNPELNKERDTETGNDDFGARYYSNRFGRWLSADWSSVPVPVPYANLTNPQTLNLYSMVSDDPESFADLDGHECTTLAGAGPQTCATNNNTPPLQGENSTEGSNRTGTGESSTAETPDQAQVNAQQNANQQAQKQGQDEKKATTPPPINPDGTPKPPSEPPPPGKGPDGKLVPNEWVPGKGTPDRPVRWDPKYPVPGQSPPNVSWDDKQGHLGLQRRPGQSNAAAARWHKS